MALFIRQNEEKSEFQQRLAAELQEKARKKAAGDQPDGVTDSAYLKGTKETTSLAWVWIVIAFFAVGVFVFYIVGSSR